MNTKPGEKIFRLMFIFVFIVGIVWMPGRSATAQEPTPVGVGLVTDEAGIADMSFNWMAYQGLQQAQIELGIVGTLYESASAIDYSPLLQRCVDEGNELCIAVGFLMADAVVAAANANPSVKFAILDVSPDSPPANLRGILFDEKEAGYLAGALTGKMTTSNVVGAVGGMEIPPVVAFVEGYRNGAQCANPNVNVLISYTGSFDNYDLGVVTAQNMISQGADALFGVGGLNGNGAIIYGTQHGTWGIGVDTDQYVTLFNNGSVSGSGNMLTSALKKLDFAVKQTISDYLNGSFSSGTVTYHLVDGGVELAPYHETDPSVPPETKSYVDSVRSGIISGSINIDETCRLLNPSFTVWLNQNKVDGYGWPENAQVTLTVGDPASPDIQVTETVSNGSWDLGSQGIRFQFGNEFQLLNGQTITLSDDAGTYTKTHTITNLVVTGISADTNTVTGAATAGSDVGIYHKWNNQIWRHEVAALDGSWAANFNLVGNEPGEEIADIQPGEEYHVCQEAQDGSTCWYLPVPNPSIGVRPNQDRVEGREWPLGAMVTVTVDDPGTLPQPDITRTAEVYEASWNPGEYRFDLNLSGEMDIQPGFEVTASAGGITKTHAVTTLAFTNIDLALDVVTGVAGPDSRVDIWACDNFTCINRHVNANSSGVWTADFAHFGDEGDEQNTFDIVPGVWIDSSQGDNDGDQTMFGQRLPNPYVQAAPYSNWIQAREWPKDTLVTLQIDDPSDGLGVLDGDGNPVDYSATAVMEQSPWNPGDPNDTVANFRWPDQFAPGLGYIITISGNGQSKSLTVSQLNITGFDLDADLISGTGTPSAPIQVCANVPNRCLTRWVTADASGNWTANYHVPGTGNDDLDTFDVRPGSNGWAAEYEADSDRTWIDWSVANPRMEVSYEHNWIQISDFTPGGEVTYTIYDYQGGHALFGPVTGPVDSHGNGWISSNLFHTDLIPGNFITAVNEAIGEEVSVLIQELNLDYIGVEDDRAFGTAEPNTTIEIHVSQTHDQGFNLTTNVDASGYWEVDFAAEGYPIDSYRHASINLYDAEGDGIVAQPPRVHAQISTDNFGVDNFSKNADVTLTLFDAPGGTILYGPVTLRTDGSGNAWANLWGTGIDLIPGNYIVAYDHTLNFTKSLEIEPFDFLELNAAEDYVSGTASGGEWVDLHVESLFSNWGLDALTDENGQWFRDYGLENYDITEQMWANGWAVDDQSNWSEDHTTGSPGLEASIAEDWINGFNFSPDRQVRIRIYQSEGGSLLADVLVNTWGNTQLNADYWTHGVDLQAGMYILAEDLETGKKSELTLVHLTFADVDYATDTAWGKADPGTAVVVRANHLFYSCETTNIADAAGGWSANLSTCGMDIDSEWDIRAMVFDLEFDATVANAPKPPEFNASLTEDWVNGNNWTPNNTVTIRLYEYEGALAVGSTFIWNTDNYGGFHADLRGEGVDLLPGNHITVTDTVNGVIKTLTLPNLTIDYLDPALDVAGGQAPPDTRLSLDFNNKQESVQFDLFSASTGTWKADFAAYDFDLQPGSSGSVRISDADGDVAQVDGYVPNPSFGARPDEDRVEGWQWQLGENVTVSIDDPATPVSPDFSGQATVGPADWNPNETWFDLNFNGQYDLKPGDQVTVTGTNTIKTHTVTSLAITNIDTVADIIAGTADSGGPVDIWIWDENGGPGRNVPVDQYGNWSANFALPGNENWENDTYDIKYGTEGESAQKDNDGDGTMLRWKAFAYTLHVVPSYPEVHGHDWRWGSDITLTIDNDTDPANGMLYQQTKNADDDPWCGYPCFDLTGVFTLEAGQYVTMTDGSETRTVRVSTLQIDSVDIVHETVSGVADPGSDVMVNIWSQEGMARHTVADTSGYWIVNFSVLGDEDFEQFTTDITFGDNGRAIQLNPDGSDDGTLEYWYVKWVPPDTIPLVIGINSDHDLSLPWLETDTLTILDQLFEPLFRLSEDASFMSAAAMQYTVSANGLVYTLSLRDMKWSDGVPVTAQHYVDGLLRLLDPASGYDFPSLFYPIAGAKEYNQGQTNDPTTVGIRAVGTNTLEITLASPTAYFPQVLAFPAFLPVRLDLIAQYGDAWIAPEHFVGNGPYRLIEHDAGHFLLERNSYYYDYGQVQFDQIGFAVISDDNERLEAYRYGEIDALWTIPRYQYPNIISDPVLSLEIDISSQPGIQSMGINVARPPTDNLPVRKALACAIDRTYLLQKVLGEGWHAEATGVIPPPLFGYQGNAVGFVYDPTKAQEYLAQAGYPGGAEFPEIKLISNKGHEAIFDYVAEQWRTVLGIPVSVEHLEWSDYVSRITNCRNDPAACDYNAYRQGWLVDYPDPNNILADLFGPDSAWKVTGWDNSRYRELLQLSASEMNPATRLGYVHEAEEILVEGDVAVVPLYFTDRLSLIKPSILPYFGTLIANLNLWNTIPTNHPPTNIVLTTPATPSPVTDFVTLQVDFSDPDVNDDHTILVDWGDTTTNTIPVTGLSAVAVHQYFSAGVYTINVTVTDTAGESTLATYKYVVIYDPDGGFVTGSGWIWSPEGAYYADPILTGKASFGFVSKYLKGTTVPTGNTEFQFHVANLNFKSTLYDWLVVAGTKAQYKGTGTIGGAGEYGFLLTVTDGLPDKFRIKIWDKMTGEIIYDNMLDAEDTAVPSTAIQGGSIVIHKEK